MSDKLGPILITGALADIGLSERVVVRHNAGTESPCFISIVLCVDEATAAGPSR